METKHNYNYTARREHTRTHQQLRAQLARDMEAYFAGGGTVDVVPIIVRDKPSIKQDRNSAVSDRIVASAMRRAKKQPAIEGETVRVLDLAKRYAIAPDTLRDWSRTGMHGFPPSKIQCGNGWRGNVVDVQDVVAWEALMAEGKP